MSINVITFNSAEIIVDGFVLKRSEMMKSLPDLYNFLVSKVFSLTYDAINGRVIYQDRQDGTTRAVQVPDAQRDEIAAQLVNNLSEIEAMLLPLTRIDEETGAVVDWLHKEW